MSNSNQKTDLQTKIKEFALSKCKSVRQFEQECALAQGSVSKLSDNTRRSTLERIKRVFPDFDIDYMLTGIAINSNNNPTSNTAFATDLYEERKRLEEIILKQQENINKQQESIDKLINTITQLTNINLKK